MKWYPHDPAAFLEGVTELSPEERGYYITLIDLYYARDGKNITDELVSQAMRRRPQEWRRVKASLIAKDKIVAKDGKLLPNRCETTLISQTKLIENMSRMGRVSALKRNEINALSPTARTNRTVGENQTQIIDSFLLRREKGIR